MISQIASVAHSSLPGVGVLPLSRNIEKGVPQQVLVHVEDGGCIPLHTHSVSAKMIVVSGEATVLSANESINGTRVGRGSVVMFDSNIPHGFSDCRGFAFISDNGGIIDQNGDWDIVMN